MKPPGKEPELIKPDELRTWVLHEDDDLIVVDKPGWVVCHPSKNGPFSSLVGAMREVFGFDVLHMVSRLDRETSGLVLFAKHKAMARALQMAFQRRAVEKNYFVLLEGELKEAVEVKRRLAKDLESEVHVKVTVRRSHSSKSAHTRFAPVLSRNGFTLARVEPETGRKHQIRAHALWLGHRVVGDKIYGPDDTLYLEFIEHGWTPRLDAALPIYRQALHAHRLRFTDEGLGLEFTAPLPEDMGRFIRKRMKISPEELLEKGF